MAHLAVLKQGILSHIFWMTLVVHVFGSEIQFSCIDGFAIDGWNNQILQSMTFDGCKSKCIQFNWCRSFDFSHLSKKCLLSIKNHNDPDVTVSEFSGIITCRPNNTCLVPNVPYATVTPQLASARDNMTITCDDNYELADGKAKVDLQCGVDGVWNNSIPTCHPKGCVAPDFNENIFDGDIASCTTYNDRQKIYIDSVRATTLTVFGHSIPCNPIAGNILILNSAGPCPLLVDSLQLPVMDSCHFKCNVGQFTRMILSNITLCEVISS